MRMLGGDAVRVNERLTPSALRPTIQDSVDEEGVLLGCYFNCLGKNWTI